MRSLLKERLEEGQKHFYGVMMMIRHDSTLLTLIFVQFFKGFIFHMFSYFQFLKIKLYSILIGFYFLASKQIPHHSSSSIFLLNKFSHAFQNITFFKLAKNKNKDIVKISLNISQISKNY